MSPSRRTLAALLAATALTPTTLAAAPGLSLSKSPKPNILFILADDLGYADLGCYGQKRIRTPNLDRLAAKGVRFSDAYCNSPTCVPRWRPAAMSIASGLGQRDSLRR